ncbi:uncharacterized protein LOC126842340 isoform X2 [Adelges cooleyi]|uniref:uncharacterized protein LOC126842340 isoform X2 n=1 Tax=Adelges cooleyi TaxID=133065 RepID=UPI00217FDB56|nr:uncharacterized protein LOC126842340 isoform X2 [Adelges cooleyi]
MRRFCFLISFVVVNVLAVVDENELIREIKFTNRQIERVECSDVRLIPVIRKYVRGDKPMEELSFMFTAPHARLRTIFSPGTNTEELLQQYKDAEIELQTDISALCGVPVPDESVGLIRTAIKKVGCAFGGSSSGDPDPDENKFPEYKAALVRPKRFRDALKLYINSLSRPGHEDFGDCNQMCRLKGVYKSVLYYTRSHIVKLAEVVGDHCHLTDLENRTIIVSCVGDDVKFVPEVHTPIYLNDHSSSSSED